MDKLRISCNQMALSSNQTSGFETLLLEATRLLSTINRKEKETDSDSHLVLWCRWRQRQHSSVRAKENPRSLSVNTRQVSKCWHYILLFVCVCVSVVIYHADHMARIVFTGRCMLLRAAAGDQDRACHTGNKFLSCEWNTCGWEDESELQSLSHMVP